MAQTLVVVVLFVAAMAALPWLVRRVQSRQAAGTQAGASSRVLSAVAVGPQQRVVTVEVGPEGARACLVLGVTAQNITCLHVMTSPAGVLETPVASFAGEMALAAQAREKAVHV